MRVKVIPGALAQHAASPSSGVPVPNGLVVLLKAAAKFTGRFSKKFADGQYVHIANGKAYATNNRHIVEIDLGCHSLGSVRLSRRDIALISSMGDDPATAHIAEGVSELKWADGRWLRIETQAVSSWLVGSCHEWLERHSDNDRAPVSAGPTQVDELVADRAGRSPAAFSFPGGHGIVLQDGFFFRETDDNLAKLVAESSIDPRLDDLFTEALEETRAAHGNNEARIKRLIARLSSIEDEIANLESENRALEETLSRQHEAIAAYQSGAELDDEQRELLTPRMNTLVSEEERAAVNAEFDRHQSQLPDGWEVMGKRMDDDYIYVTIRRERECKSKPEATVRDKVRAAVAQFFAPGFDREFRVRWDQLGTLSPIVPGAP